MNSTTGLRRIGTVLLTGGAGFIGCHVARALLERGYTVRVLDNLLEQVHRAETRRNPVLRDVELIKGDIRDLDAVASVLQGVDKIIHLAAEVGVGQSMYAIDRYVSVNDRGTAILFQALTERPVERVVVASSMSIYGEGLYENAAGQPVEDVLRPFRYCVAGGWNPADADGEALVPVPTPEWKRPNLMSVYALTKYVQERLTLTLCPVYGMEGVGLRLFNVFGPGQALSNPYTGVLAIFASRLLNGKSPLIFEDGEQRRDFVHVDDAASAFILALERPDAAGEVFNIGSGCDRSISNVARDLAEAMGRSSLLPELIGKARVGDIRHCFADITHARQRLGYEPRRNWADSLAELAEWVAGQGAVDRVVEAKRELEVRGLVA
ncbi:MAG: dTDP-L-rhamnose 4-epimerase [Rhodospirillaceae bacterium]|nr:dTDP-L-rhamnose 4-epimerase [Rhodospirillaceae bacterium]